MIMQTEKGMRMDRAAILDTVIQLVSETLGVDASSVNEDTTFASLNADSFDMLELVTSMEDEFGMAFDESQLSSITTVHDAVDAIAAAQ